MYADLDPAVFDPTTMADLLLGGSAIDEGCAMDGINNTLSGQD